MWWTGLHLFFISRFFFWPFFLTFFKWWQWLEGHSFGLVLGIFVFVLNYSDLFGFIRSSRQAWLGESWQKLCRKSRQIGLSLCPKRGRFGPCLRYKPEKYWNIIRIAAWHIFYMQKLALDQICHDGTFQLPHWLEKFWAI